MTHNLEKKIWLLETNFFFFRTDRVLISQDSKSSINPKRVTPINNQENSNIVFLIKEENDKHINKMLKGLKKYISNF